jgi:CBS domain-containing protein
MKIKKMKEIMVPLSEYATVDEDTTLENAIKTLYTFQKATEKYKYKHRAVLVYDKTGNVVGKVSALDVLRALEPKYSKLFHSDHSSQMGLSRFGLNNDFLNSLLEKFNLWDESSESLVKKAAKRKVKDIMHSSCEGEFVDENATIAEAVHQFILGHHQSLLVLKDEKVVGIVRLTDVFNLITDLMVQ